MPLLRPMPDRGLRVRFPNNPAQDADRRKNREGSDVVFHAEAAGRALLLARRMVYYFHHRDERERASRCRPKRAAGGVRRRDSTAPLARE